MSSRSSLFIGLRALWATLYYSQLSMYSIVGDVPYSLTFNSVIPYQIKFLNFITYVAFMDVA